MTLDHWFIDSVKSSISSPIFTREKNLKQFPVCPHMELFYILQIGEQVVS